MTESNPVKFIGENNVLCGVEVIKMKLGGKDSDGRNSVSPIEGSNFIIKADVVIIAIGQGPNPLLLRMLPQLKLNKNGSIAVDENGKTSIAKVYAGGDATTGAATVILSMGTAKKAAHAIDKALRSA